MALTWSQRAHLLEELTFPDMASALMTEDDADLAVFVAHLNEMARLDPTDKLEVFLQSGFVCGTCYGRDALVELRPRTLGRFWCPACRREKWGRRVMVYGWPQWQPLPDRPSGRVSRGEDMFR